jgi:hypothetical protein
MRQVLYARWVVSRQGVVTCTSVHGRRGGNCDGHRKSFELALIMLEALTASERHYRILDSTGVGENG